MTKKYNIIYADPAWTFETRSKKGKEKSPEKHYKCMTKADIEALPVADWCEDDAVLLLWTTDTHLPQALELIEKWGFTYKTVGFTWVKLNKRWAEKIMYNAPDKGWLKSLFCFGMGFYTRANPEMCLLATRGKPLKRMSHSVRQLVVETIREHSRKPDRIRDDIVELFGDLPRLEMFARTRAEGWDVFGNEVDKYEK